VNRGEGGVRMRTVLSVVARDTKVAVRHNSTELCRDNMSAHNRMKRAWKGESERVVAKTNKANKSKLKMEM
jgi:hypothetical protein